MQQASATASRCNDLTRRGTTKNKTTVFVFIIMRLQQKDKYFQHRTHTHMHAWGLRFYFRVCAVIGARGASVRMWTCVPQSINHKSQQNHKKRHTVTPCCMCTCARMSFCLCVCVCVCVHNWCMRVTPRTAESLDFPPSSDSSHPSFSVGVRPTALFLTRFFLIASSHCLLSLLLHHHLLVALVGIVRRVDRDRRPRGR